jgi:hypothetical protein
VFRAAQDSTVHMAGSEMIMYGRSRVITEALSANTRSRSEAAHE